MRQEFRLRTWLVALMSTAITLSFILVAAAILLYRLPQVEAQARQQVQASAEKMALLTERFLFGVEEQVLPLAELLAIYPPQFLQHYLDAVVHHGWVFDAVSVLDETGRVLALGLPPARRAVRAELMLADLSANRLFLSARQAAAQAGSAPPRPIWSDQYLSPLTGEMTVGLAVAAGPYLIIGELSRPRLLAMLQGFEPVDGSQVAILDRRGQWLAGAGRIGRHHNFGGTAAFQAAIAGAPMPRYEIVAGHRILPGAAVSTQLGWVFGAALPAGMNHPGYRITVLLVLFGFVATLLITLALAPFWAAQMERPIRRMIDHAHRLAAFEGSAVESPQCRVSELNQLGDDLAAMTRAIRTRAAELRRSEGEVRQLNLELEARVRHRTQELAQARDQLQTMLEHLQATQNQLVQAEKLAALGNLVAGVAHELNTPIGNGLMAISTLDDQLARFRQAMRDGLRRSELEQFLAAVATASDIGVRNLHRAADLVTSFKQVAVDQTSAQRRRFQLAEVVHEIAVTLQPSLKRTPYALTTEVAPELALDSFPGPLGQVLANLVNNAVIHGFAGRDHGQIRILGEAEGDDQVRLTVTDDGCGIPPELHHRVFDPFYTTRMGQGGSGLGLHIVYNVVTGVLGGRIEIVSQPGQGAAFVIHLPRRAPDHAGGGASA